MFFLTWSGPAPVLFSIPIRVWGGSRRKVQLRRCGLKTVGRSCQGLHFRGRKQSVPELPVSCVCFTQVKPRSYAGALWAKQVPCRKHSALWGQDLRSKWVQPREPALAGYGSCSIPSPWNIPRPLLSTGMEQSRHPSPNTLCFEVPQPHARWGGGWQTVSTGHGRQLGRARLPEQIFSASGASSAPLAVPAGYGKSRPAADFKTLF